MTPGDVIPFAHAAATGVMTGLIWFVQVVHYPLLARVGAASFVEYERAHVRRTTWVVAPAMLVEAATAIVLPFVSPTQPDVARRLVATNWIRTVCWSLRLLIALGLLSITATRT